MIMDGDEQNQDTTDAPASGGGDAPAADAPADGGGSGDENPAS